MCLAVCLAGRGLRLHVAGEQTEESWWRETDQGGPPAADQVLDLWWRCMSLSMTWYVEPLSQKYTDGIERVELYLRPRDEDEFKERFSKPAIG